MMNIKLRRHLLIGLIAAVGWTPLTASADAVVVTNFSVVTAVIKQVYDSVVSGTKATTAALMAHSSQMTAAMQQQSVVNKTIAEASMDYQAQMRFKERALDVENSFGSTDPNSPEQQEACRAIGAAEAIQQAEVNKQEIARALSDKSHDAITTRVDPVAVARETIRVHNENFCSDKDFLHGRCKIKAPDHLQGADLKAVNLFNPSDSLTYGQKEEMAAQTFVESIVVSSAPTALNKKAEATPAGKAYLAAQMIEQRKQDIAAETLREIFASRKAVPGLGTNLGLNTRDVSFAGAMKSYASKFLDQDFMSTKLPAMGHQQLAAEQVRLMAFQVWMDYQTYLRAERTSAIVAVQALDQMKNNPSHELLELRKRANTVN